MKPKINDETPDQGLTQDYRYESFEEWVSVDEVNGAVTITIDAPNFIPTRHELFQLAKYWIESDIQRSYGRYLTGCCGSIDLDIHCFANRRTERIARVLGEGALEEAKKQVFKEFSDRDPVAWEMFLEDKPVNLDEDGRPIIPRAPATSDVTPKKAKRVKRSRKRRGL